MTVCSCPDAIKHTQIFEELEACKAKLAEVQSYKFCGIVRYRDELLRQDEVEHCDSEEEDLNNLIYEHGRYLVRHCDEYVQFLLG